MADAPTKNGEKMERNPNGTFAPGHTAHKAGRPKKPPELKAAADEALEMLIKMARDPKTSDKLRADIGTRLYEWQYGKATQRVAGDADESAIKIEIPDALKRWAD